MITSVVWLDVTLGRVRVIVWRMRWGCWVDRLGGSVIVSAGPFWLEWLRR